ncbi:MAG: ketoacyl-ACP synthase III [Pirellulales bacterium]
MNFAAVGPIAVHLPAKVETNDELRQMFPRWDIDLIYSKTGIRARHIAAPGECASDLGVAAAEKLFRDFDIDRRSIDFLLFCTQTPDYPLPTTACLMQNRLGLRTTSGAIDFNLGCSGFVYGLGLADGLIRGGSAKRVLLITAETYSRYIDAEDRSLRTIFGDGAAATLLEATDRPMLRGFQYGTDGSGADRLFVCQGGARDEPIKSRTRHRWASPLYMDGPGLVDFTVESIPQLAEEVLRASQFDRKNVDLYILHQATLLMLNRLREGLRITPEQLPIVLEECGNTVSSTIPIVIESLRGQGKLHAGMNSLLIGFGVGLSWAGCLWEESFAR